MKRRDFLKTIGAGAAVAAVPAIGKAEAPIETWTPINDMSEIGGRIMKGQLMEPAQVGDLLAIEDESWRRVRDLESAKTL
jgi:hypothetical protein